ncbi:PAS domain-containing protein [Spirosoma foliorum]|uniref:histidine kinase n=1 Tax=Spirosoma foliorum TaxID=2710596 RepID=A0A7G5GUE1_9BACT|nr:PAS domain-containing protein [Spirosoma foliorum]QMW02483.1 PAS domain-containing protein [Spirosoma foliorum]
MIHILFYGGGGQMGALIRAYDWAASPLGSPSQWPSSLRTSVSNMLHTGLPMLVLWGSELICLYNDYVIPSLDPTTQHPAIGKPSAQIWPQAWPVVGPLLEGVLKNGEPVTFQDVPMLFYRHGDTEEVFWTFCYSAIVTDDGRIGGILATCLETTQAVRARQQLEQNQQQLLTSFKEAPVAIAVVSKEKLTFRMANPFYGQLVGRTPDELVDKPLLEALPELAGQGFDRLLEDVIATGTPYSANEVAVELVRNNQLETIYVNLTYQPRREVDKAISGVLVVATDVTQQVVTRKKIEESKAHLDLLSNTVPAMIFYLDLQQRYQSYNETFMQWFNVGPTEVLGKTVREFLGDAAYQKVLPHLAIAYAGQQERYELWSPAKMGKGKWLDITYTPHKTTEGSVLGLIVHAADITQTKQAEVDLRDSEASLQGAIELAELGTWQIDLVTGTITFSERLQAWLGIQTAELEAEASPRIHPKDRERIRLALGKALEKGSSGYFDEVYTILNTVTGQDRVIHANGQTLFDADGTPRSIAGTAQDVTIQQELQLALENEVQTRTEELATTNQDLTAINEELLESTALLVRSNENLQKFAYIASHDLQEPLRKIQQFGDLLKTGYARSPEEALTYVERMQSAASRMSMLIRDLLSFSRISTRRDASAPVLLQPIVASVLQTLELVIQETGAHIHVGLLPIISGDAIQLSQLFQNLLSNALKFRLPAISPVIEIKAQRVAVTDLPTGIKPGRLAPEYYCIDVIDNGVGFDEKYLDRIFQVFQRLHSKSEFAGTGIGLAICEKVVTNHGGAITASSQPGQGATFSVYFPVE